MNCRRRQFLVLTLAIGVACAALVAVGSAEGESLTAAALEETRLAQNAEALETRALELAGGGLLFGLGLGAVIASGVTYWYKNREIRRRLE